MDVQKIRQEELKSRFHIAKDGLRILLHILGLSSHPDLERRDDLIDPVIVAIDFENTHLFQQKLPPGSDFQVGLAVLDTRSLRFSLPPEHVISSFNYVCGSSAYTEKAFSKFMFGVPVEIKQDELLANITSCIGKDRNIILVGHSIHADISILSKLGFDPQERQVSICLDTYKICAQVLPFFNLKLCELLDELDCPYNRLHNGGNDATFTLRALLLLAVKHQVSQDQDEELLRYLESIGRLKLPNQSPGRAQVRVAKKVTMVEDRLTAVLEILTAVEGRLAAMEGRLPALTARKVLADNDYRAAAAATAHQLSLKVEEAKNGIHFMRSTQTRQENLEQSPKTKTEPNALSTFSKSTCLTSRSGHKSRIAIGKNTMLAAWLILNTLSMVLAVGGLFCPISLISAMFLWQLTFLEMWELCSVVLQISAATKHQMGVLRIAACRKFVGFVSLCLAFMQQ